MQFRPMLGCNEHVDIYALRYPIIASIKRDGIRSESAKSKFLSRSLKPIQNKQVCDKFKPLVEYATANQLVIESELYIHGLPLNEHNIFINTSDLNTRDHHNKIKRMLRDGELTNSFHYYTSLPSTMKAYIFDCVKNTSEGYVNRLNRLRDISIPEVEVIIPVEITTPTDLLLYYKQAIFNGFEGLVLRSANGHYKLGRSTLKEQLFLKMKDTKELIGTILGITERNENLEDSFINELGYKTKRNISDNKKGTGIAAALVVSHKGHEVKVTMTGNMTYRKQVYDNMTDYIGRSVMFKGLLTSIKNKPLQPVLIKIL